MTLKPDPTTAGYDAGVDGIPVNMVQSQVASGDGGGAVTNTGLTDLANVYDQVTHYLATKDIVLKDCVANNVLATSNAILAACEDTQTHYLAVKDVTLGAMGTTPINISGAVTNAVLTALEDQTTHYIGTKDVTLMGCISNNVVAVSGTVTASGAFTNAILTAIEDQRVHYIATAPTVSTATMHSAYATDTPTTGTDFDVTGMKMVAVQVVTAAATTSFTLDFQVSVDGTNFVPNCIVTSFADGSDNSSLTGAASFNGAYNIMVAGVAKLRCNLSAFAHGSGSITVSARALA